MQDYQKTDNTNVIKEALVKYLGLRSEMAESYAVSLNKCYNIVKLTEVIVNLGKKHFGQKPPTSKQINDAYFEVFTKKDEFKRRAIDCNYCNSAGYATMLYEYNVRLPIPNTTEPIPTVHIEKVAMECFCGKCDSKNQEPVEVRRSRVMKYGWFQKNKDRFLEDCQKMEEELSTPSTSQFYRPSVDVDVFED